MLCTKTYESNIVRLTYTVEHCRCRVGDLTFERCQEGLGLIRKRRNWRTSALTKVYDTRRPPLSHWFIRLPILLQASYTDQALVRCQNDRSNHERFRR